MSDLVTHEIEAEDFVIAGGIVRVLHTRLGVDVDMTGNQENGYVLTFKAPKDVDLSFLSPHHVREASDDIPAS
jgi:hypothetical protein